METNNSILTIVASLRQHRREFGAKSPMSFAEIYMKNNCSCDYSRMHHELFSALAAITTKRKARLAIAAPRGHAKSTIVSLVYVLWCILYSKEKLIILASNTREQAVTLLKDIKHQLKTNPLLLSDFPEICIEKKPKPWRDSRIQLPNGAMVCAYGVGQSPRGLKNDKDRPGLIIADDLENEEQAESEEQREKLTNWFKGALLNTGHPDTNVIVIGTILHHNSLLAALVGPQKTPGWCGKKYKAVEQFTSNPQLWEKWSAIFSGREEFKGQAGVEAARTFYELNKEAMLKDTKVLWPQLEDYYQLMSIRETEGIRSFMREKQNEPIDPAQCIFNQDKFVFWDDEFRDTQHLIEAIGKRGLFYGACDPSMGRSIKGDYAAIIVLLKDIKTNILYVIVADITYRTPDATIQRIIQYADIYRFLQFAVESNNFQQMMVDDLQRRLLQKGHNIKIQSLPHSSQKQSRICSLEPYVSQGFLRFSRKHQELLQQLTQFPLAKNDDGPDALEMAVDTARKPMRIVGIWPGMYCQEHRDYD
jgi:predicted phage terminase large subunit-like protein